MLSPAYRECWRRCRRSHWYVRHDDVKLQSKIEAVQPLQEELVMGKVGVAARDPKTGRRQAT